MSDYDEELLARGLAAAKRTAAETRAAQERAARRNLYPVPDMEPEPSESEPPDDADPGPSEWKGSDKKSVVEQPRLWNATDLAPSAQPSWLATNRLPRSAISLLIGDEGIGKSLLWVLVVAHITTGRALPAFGIPARDPGRVMLVITEDDWSTAVRPRLELAGAVARHGDGTGLSWV